MPELVATSGISTVESQMQPANEFCEGHIAAANKTVDEVVDEDWEIPAHWRQRGSEAQPHPDFTAQSLVQKKYNTEKASSSAHLKGSHKSAAATMDQPNGDSMFDGGFWEGGLHGGPLDAS